MKKNRKKRKRQIIRHITYPGSNGYSIQQNPWLCAQELTIYFIKVRLCFCLCCLFRCGISVREGGSRSFFGKRRLQNQFKDALNAIQVGIASGYSLENTVREARKDLERIYSKEAEMTQNLPTWKVR